MGGVGFALEHVIEAMVDVVFVVDASGDVVLANRAAIEVTGYALAELHGLPIARVLEDSESGLRTRVRERIAGGSALRRETAQLLTKSGSKIPVSVTAAPVLDETGGLTGIVLVARDIREMLQLLADRDSAAEQLRITLASIESQLEHALAQLSLAERRATVGTLAGGLGHELQRIATTQTAATEAFRAAMVSLETSDPVRENIQGLLFDLARIREQLGLHSERLVQLAQLGPDHDHPHDLNELVRDVVAMLQAAGRLRRIAVVTSLDPTPIHVTANRTRVEQVLVNLIVNSVDALTLPGTISITTRPDRAAKRVRVEVGDSGTGISPEHVEQIFESFYTTKPENRAGLGLSVAREIVVRYGGTLAVTTAVGIGTTFTFDLPIA